MHRSLALALFSCLVLALAPRTAEAQSLWIVDTSGGPGADFTQLTPAIAAAADGDVILIRPGYYAGGTVNAKALTLIGDGTGKVGVAGLDVSDLAPSQGVLARGLALQGYSRMSDCFGSVRIEDCSIRLLPGGFGQLGAMRVERCEDFALARCTTEPAFSSAFGGATVYGVDSTIAIHESVLKGLGGDVFVEGDGADAVEVLRSTLVLAGSELTGGHQGDTEGGFSFGSAGGHGVHAIDSAVRRADTVLAGGFSATDPGLPIALEGTSTDVIQAAHSLRLDPPGLTHALTAAHVQLTGPPSALAVLGIGTSPASFATPGVLGQILIGGPYVVVPLGFIGGGGKLKTTLLAPPLLPGAEASVWWTQSLMVTPIGGAVPGAPVSWVVLP